MNETEQTLKARQPCEQVLELLPAYVIGATDPEETAFVKANLAACPEAAAVFPSYQRLVEQMRVDVPQIEPSADLEERLMKRLSSGPSAARPAVRRSRSGFPILAAAAAALVLLVGSNFYWLLRVNHLAQENDALAVQLQQEQDSSNALASLAQAQWRRLEGTQDSNVLALVIWEDHDCFLYTLGMPSLPPDKVYQLWLVESNDRHVSAGTFRVDERGRGVLTCNAPEDFQQFARMGITAEPMGGSTDPTSDPVAQGNV
jgi:anti-sigma-K factor RskA